MMPNQPPTPCAQCLIRIGLKSDFSEPWVDSGSVGDTGEGAEPGSGAAAPCTEEPQGAAENLSDTRNQR